MAEARGSDAAAGPAPATAYVDSENGFKLVPPSGWSQGSKSGAAVLFKDPSYKFNNLGVTVTPVRVSSLEAFGTAEETADKLIAFEKNKESTKVATVNSASARKAASSEAGSGSESESVLYYDFDYSLETTRGNKRVVSTVTIVNSKLYIANGQYFCGDECGDEGADKLAVIKEALSSFAATQ